jgi:hypothetical protein
VPLHGEQAYRNRITVVTEDDDEQADYESRGNVCISNLPVSADVAVENGGAAARACSTSW